jgi:hypothetical protein
VEVKTSVKFLESSTEYTPTELVAVRNDSKSQSVLKCTIALSKPEDVGILFIWTPMSCTAFREAFN